MGKNDKNPNSVLFLVEGYTEVEFYNRIFDIKIPPRKIRINKKNMKGNWAINKKIRNAINELLDDKSKKDQVNIYVFVAIDREGTREKEPESCINIDGLKKEFIKNKKSRIKDISEIVATQDLESWFFHDIDGIFDYLNVPENQRNSAKYADVEKNTNNKVLSQLFKKYGKLYYKRGDKVAEVLDKLDLNKIYSKALDLQVGIQQIEDLTN